MWSAISEGAKDMYVAPLPGNGLAANARPAAQASYFFLFLACCVQIEHRYYILINEFVFTHVLRQSDRHVAKLSLPLAYPTDSD